MRNYFSPLVRQIADSYRHEAKYGYPPCNSQDCIHSMGYVEKKRIRQLARKLYEQDPEGTTFRGRFYDQAKDEKQKTLQKLAFEMKDCFYNSACVEAKLSSGSSEPHGRVVIELPTAYSFGPKFKDILEKMLFVSDSLEFRLAKADSFQEEQLTDQSLTVYLLRNFRVRLTLTVFDIWKEYDWISYAPSIDDYEALQEALGKWGSRTSDYLEARAQDFYYSKANRLRMLNEGLGVLMGDKVVKRAYRNGKTGDNGCLVDLFAFTELRHRYKKAFQMMLSSAEQVSFRVFRSDEYSENPGPPPSEDEQDSESKELDALVRNYNIVVQFLVAAVKTTVR